MSYVPFKQPSLGLLDEHGLIRRDLASAPDRLVPHGLKIHINNSHGVERYRERGHYHDPQMDDTEEHARWKKKAGTEPLAVWIRDMANRAAPPKVAR